MTTVPLIELAKALQTKLALVLATSVGRRYVTVIDQQHPGLAEGIWNVLAAEDDPRRKRNIDFPELTLALVYQRLLPDSTRDWPDPLANLPFLDACAETVQRVKDLFGEDGTMRRQVLAECEFVSLRHSPLFRPDLLLEHKIYTAVLELKYELSTDSDD